MAFNERIIAMSQLKLDHPVHLEAVLMDIWNKWLEGLITRSERNLKMIFAISRDELAEMSQR